MQRLSNEANIQKNMLLTTEDRIHVKHYRLDKNMAVGQYA